MSSISIIEKAEAKQIDGWRIIALPAGAMAPIATDPNSVWKRFPLGSGGTLLAISDQDYTDLLLDYATRDIMGEKSGELETVLLRKLAGYGEIANTYEAARIGLAHQGER